MTTIYLRAGPTDEFLTASFSYDEDVLAAIKSVPGRKYDPQRRVWYIPSTPEAYDDLVQRARMLHVDVAANPEVRERHEQAVLALAQARAVKARGDAEVDFEFLTEPYAHQRAGLEFLATLGGGALLWEMGTGKTKTAIDFCEWLALADAEDADRSAKRGTPAGHVATAGSNPHSEVPASVRQPLRVLVICPNTVKRTWADEIELHAGHQGYAVLEGTIPQRVAQLGKQRYSIVNCEALSIAQFAKAAIAREWDVVIVDESTRFKTPGAARTKALHKLTARHRLILTGTPITGKPEDAWAQLHFVAPGLLGSYWSFRDRYIQLDFFNHPAGLKPGMAPELNRIIESRSYRVLKDDVLDLPPKVYEDRVVELSGDQRKAYDQMRDELLVAIEGMEQATAYNILTVLLRLTQITAGLVGGGERYSWLDRGNAKLDELDDLLNDELAGQPVVVFAMYQRELEKLALRYAPPSVGRDEWDLPAILYGPTPEKRRHELIEQFQSGQRRLLFAQIRTGGIGITLTAAKTAIYYTRGWSLEEYLQSQDRLHRIGQTRSVTILHLIAKGTVDEDIAKALRKKQNLADQLTGDDARRLARDLLERKLS